MPLSSFDILSWLYIPPPVALAIVAFIGYLVGRQRRMNPVEAKDQARREMKRAQSIAKDLERVASEVRRSLARHHASIERFKSRVGQLSDERNETAWKELCQEAEAILGPTMQLGTQIAAAYDEIRRQSNQLMTFTAVRTDPLTGVSNRRAMDETLENWAAMKSRYELGFSIVIFDIDYFKRINDERGHPAGDKVLRSVAQIIDDTARDTDVVTRYGGEEFVVLTPQTDLRGACIFADRVRHLIFNRLGLTISAGVASAETNESPQSLLERADAALYHAKSNGRNQTSYHDGLNAQNYSMMPELPAGTDSASPSSVADRIATDSAKLAAPAGSDSHATESTTSDDALHATSR